MSHTNSTTNYNLPQFVGTDKPTWLTDVNGAMSAIDTQMKANADSATTANGVATSVSTAVGTLANLTTTNKTDAVSAINEVNGNLSTVSGVASGASTTATNAKNTADAIKSFLTLTTFKDLTWNVTSGSVSGLSTGSVGAKSACNIDGSLGKIYGECYFTCTSTNGCTLTSSDTGLRPSSEITINGIALRQNRNTTWPAMGLSVQSVVIHTDGTISISVSGAWYNTSIGVYFLAGLIFASDFGDIPEA